MLHAQSGSSRHQKRVQYTNNPVKCDAENNDYNLRSHTQTHTHTFSLHFNRSFSFKLSDFFFCFHFKSFFWHFGMPKNAESFRICFDVNVTHTRGTYTFFLYKANINRIKFRGISVLCSLRVPWYAVCVRVCCCFFWWKTYQLQIKYWEIKRCHKFYAILFL